MKDLTRRNFVKSASLGAAGIGLSGFAKAENPDGKKPEFNSREVYVASLTMDKIKGKDVRQVTESALKQMEIALPMSPDVYCLPEVFHLAGVIGGRPPKETSSED